MQIHWSAAIAVGIVVYTTAARAEEGPCAKVDRSNVVRCAESASVRVRLQQRDADIAGARRKVASTLLPSNPNLLVTGGRRNADAVPAGATNWYATLSQEIEIAGQRGLRRDAAEHAESSERRQIVAVERDVAAHALGAYFDALAANEQLRLARRLEDVGANMARATRARADSGVASPLEADVADATALGLVRARLGAEREADRARVELTTLLGRDALATLVDVTGELAPLAQPAGTEVEQQPELQALEQQRLAQAAQADVLRRTRIPNPTFQVYVQNDGFNERVYGGGVSFPIPLPAPVGRVNRGEIAEAEARAARVATEAEGGRREIRRRIAIASRSLDSRRREVEAFTPERVKHAEQTLSDIGTEVTAGRLAVRDAVVAQQALIDLLRGNIMARRDLCLASVELARAAGVELERGAE